MVSVVKEPRANRSRLSPTLAQSLLWKGLTSSWSVHRAESCMPWLRQDNPNLLVLVSWLSQGQKQIPIRETFHCTGWEQHKPYFGSSLQDTLKGRCQIDIMVQLDSLLGDIDSRKPPAYLSPRNATFNLPHAFSTWRTVPLQVWLLWVWADTHSGTCKSCMENEDWQETFPEWY